MQQQSMLIFFLFRQNAKRRMFLSSMLIIYYINQMKTKFPNPFYKSEKVCFLFNENQQKFGDINTTGDLYNEFYKILDSREIIIFINDKVCLKKEKLQKYQGQQIKIETFEYQLVKRNQDQKMIEQLKLENIKLLNENQQLNKQVQEQKEVVDFLKTSQKSKIEKLVKQVEDLEKKQQAQSEIKQNQELVTSYFEQIDNEEDRQKQASYYNNVLTTKYQAKLIQLSTYSNGCISVIKTQLSKCHFCQQQIQENFILLNCSHHYHEECLQNLIEAQLTDKQPYLACLCATKITKQTLKLLDQLFANKSLLDLYQIELELLKKCDQFKFVKCKNRYCYFFYIEVGVSKSYCPLCLQ